MSFTFNGVSFREEFPGCEAIQSEYPNLSNLSVDSLEIPRMERRRFLETTRPNTSIEFYVILRGDTPEELEETRDRFMLLYDPTLGPGRLVLDEDPDWFWDMTLADEIVWERLTWECGRAGNAGGYRVAADVKFESFNDAAQRLVEEAWGPTEPPQPTQENAPDDPDLPDVTSIRCEGNTRTWPTVQFTATATAAQTVRVTVGGFTVDMAGPFTAQDTAVLDYDLMRFELFREGVKVASLVPRMSTLDRLEIRPQDGWIPVTVEPMDGGTVSDVKVKPNSRKQ